jgi:hypothetical protein
MSLGGGESDEQKREEEELKKEEALRKQQQAELQQQAVSAIKRRAGLGFSGGVGAASLMRPPSDSTLG